MRTTSLNAQQSSEILHSAEVDYVHIVEEAISGLCFFILFSTYHSNRILTICVLRLRYFLLPFLF